MREPTTEQEIQRVQSEIEDYREAARLKEAVLRLERNRDFKKLIMDKFLTEECARHVQNSVNPNLSESVRSESLGMAQAAGYLKAWIAGVVQMGTQASYEIPENEAYLAQLRAEAE